MDFKKVKKLNVFKNIIPMNLTIKDKFKIKKNS